ncbi:VWA domain-containing protein [Bifidobacterium sp. 82T24]|uniref:Spy0128 family protein n=1 Tax=Bifidobacterium pluvialisilvae TaxID=2834436 RepID=UPI001C584AAE|nr:FctA domain-containing protein [Bifidobacterium pluvialisilvae]MBW3087575.1 VWA domain-containing protein [Bifidobacterium pluvialisilvae]
MSPLRKHAGKTGLRGMVKAAVAAVVSVATFGTLAIAGAGVASATETTAALPQPESSKTVTRNNDGTYTMKLSVTGKTAEDSVTKTTPTDIVLVVDKSNSMEGNRFNTAKNAATGLANKLLTADNAKSGTVRMSVVTFASRANQATSWTTDANAVNRAIGNGPDGESQDGGTNWDDALEKANARTTDRDSAKYIVFLSDGQPTYRNGRSCTGWGWHEQCSDISGTGHDDNDGKNFEAAVAEANKRGNAELYSVSAAPEANARMSEFARETHGTFFDGSDSTKLNDAFNSIYEKITTSAAYRNVVITDALSEYVTFADGTPQFTATKDGKPWAEAPTPAVDGKTITWNLGDSKLDPVKYEISVKLKPTQAAYDQAVKNGKESTLPSNDDATVSYDVVTTVNGKETVNHGTPVTLLHGNITVPVSKVTIKKVWEGNGPKSDVTVELDKDGAKYADVTLTEQDGWTKDVIVPAGLDAYTWSVKEPTPGDGYTVAISGDNDKKFAVGTADSGTITVTNTYEAKPATLSGKDYLKGTKTFTGREGDKWLDTDKFAFTLAANDDATAAAIKADDVTLPKDTTVTVDGKTPDHAFSFGDVTFAKAGDYSFKISETKGDIPGVTYDAHAYVVNVTVTDNGKGQLEAVAKPGDASNEFKNTYAVSGDVTSDPLTAKKTLAGTKLADGQFSFTAASDDADAPKFQQPTAKNDADGKVSFGTVTFDKAGTYVYKVAETNDAQKNVKYDDTTYTVTYTVADDTKGGLTITKTAIEKTSADGTKTPADAIAFVNHTSIPATPLTPAKPVEKPQPNKPTTPTEKPQVQQQNQTAPAKQLSRTGAAVAGIAALAIVAAGAGVIAIRRRRA